jgi:hypothetical protein
MEVKDYMEKELDMHPEERVRQDSLDMVGMDNLAGMVVKLAAVVAAC